MQLVGFCGDLTVQKLRLPSVRLLTNCLPSWCQDTDRRPTPCQTRSTLKYTLHKARGTVLPLWRPLLPYGYSYPVPDQV